MKGFVFKIIIMFAPLQPPSQQHELVLTYVFVSDGSPIVSPRKTKDDIETSLVLGNIVLVKDPNT